MREVAALAGVSLKTVSRVVNTEPGVSPALRERVSRAVEALDYRPNLAASSLRRSGDRPRVIGVLVPDLGDPAAGELLATVEDAARAHATSLVVASVGHARDREEELLHDLVTRRVDGILLVPGAAGQEHLRPELRSGTPVVVVDRVPRGTSADSVVIDHAAGAREAALHLLRRRHRRIAGLFHEVPEAVARQRLEGFTAAFAERGRRLRAELVVTGSQSRDDAASAVARLLEADDPPTALVTAGREQTVGALRALSELGRRRAVAHVALDDLDGAPFLDPPLTVVRYDVSRLGAVAADILLERIAGRRGRARRVVLSPSLVERGSGELRPG